MVCSNELCERSYNEVTITVFPEGSSRGCRVQVVRPGRVISTFLLVSYFYLHNNPPAYDLSSSVYSHPVPWVETSLGTGSAEWGQYFFTEEIFIDRHEGMLLESFLCRVVDASLSQSFHRIAPHSLETAHTSNKHKLLPALTSSLKAFDPKMPQLFSERSTVPNREL